MNYIISILVSLITGTLVFIIQSLLKENRTLRDSRKNQNLIREKATEEALQCLLRVKLIEYHDKFIDMKSIPSYALQNWDLMYKSYHNLGGNGMITGMDIEIRKLPIE